MVTHPPKDSTRRSGASDPALKRRARLLGQTFKLSDDEAARYAELTAKVSDEEAVRYVASRLERARQHDEALREALAEREAKREADAARGMRQEFPAELAVARSKLEKCYREQREPDEGFSGDIARLAAEATLALAQRPDPPKHYRKVYEDAQALHDDYLLFLAARFLQGARPSRTESEHTGYVLAVLARLYWDRAGIYPLLGRAVEALRAFGGASETRTPREAVIDACGQPSRVSQKSLGMAVRRISELPENTYERQRLERCIGELDDADAGKYVEYVYLGRGPAGYGKGTTDLEREGWTRRRMHEAKRRADAALIAYFPELAKLKA